MVWAFVLVAVAALGVLAMMRRQQKPAAPAPRDDRDDDTDGPPRTDSPRHGTPRPKQLLTPGGSQPLAKPAHVPPTRPPSSIPLEEPAGDLELGAPGAAPKVEAVDPVVAARTKSATIPPVVRSKAPSIVPEPRAKVPTMQPSQQVAAESGLSMRAKRPSSSPPLSEGGVVVRMRPPSQPPPMSSDTPKRGTPGTGVVIRGKPPTAPPLLEGSRRGTPGSGVPTSRTKTPGSVPVIAPPEEAEVVPPSALANKLQYATLTATISHVGIDARREDGMTRKVMWPDVVGIVARRLPPDEPYESTTFIDIVSTAGATLRILPWTRLAGDRIDGEGIERARGFVQLAAARCPGAKLDAATRTFLGSHGPAAQLPDESTLAAHDKRLS